MKPVTHDHRLTFRLDHGIYAQLMTFCMENAMKPSEAIRFILTDYFVMLRKKAK